MVALARLADRLAGCWPALLLAADETTQPLLMRLDPPNRARLMLALVALVLVGVLLVALAIIGGRSVLRMARKSHGPTPRYEDHWYRKPLAPRDSPSSDSDLE